MQLLVEVDEVSRLEVGKSQMQQRVRLAAAESCTALAAPGTALSGKHQSRNI
jgi:hypothetical protein